MSKEKSKSASTENKAETLPAVAEQTTSLKALALANGRTFKVARRVTIPVLAQKGNDVVAFTVLSPMYMGKEIEGKDGKPAMAAATLVRVTDLNSPNPDNAERLYVVPTVLKNTWADEYKNDSYVGKSFAVQKQPQQEGKRHRNVTVVEITLD